MKTRISLALGLLGTVIGGIFIYRNRQKWNREMLYRLARLEADLLEALRDSPERRKQIPENSLVLAIPDFDEELADQNRKLATKEGKNYSSVTYCYVMKKAKGVKIYRIEVVETVRKCDLPRYLSSEDALWFKKESDTLWYKRIKLVHPDEKCLYTAEIKDQEEWEEEYHVTTRWMFLERNRAFLP